jgi:hypothetical protein
MADVVLPSVFRYIPSKSTFKQHFMTDVVLLYRLCDRRPLSGEKPGICFTDPTASTNMNIAAHNQLHAFPLMAILVLCDL